MTGSVADTSKTVGILPTVVTTDACQIRHGTARPGQLTHNHAATGGPDEPYHDVEGQVASSVIASVCPVGVVGGLNYVRLGDGADVLITLNRQPAILPAGWLPLFVYTGFAPILLLELRHPDGRQSTWFLSAAFDRVAYDDPGTLAEPARDALRQAACGVLARMWDQLLAGRDATPDADVAGFLALGSAIRRRLAALCEATTGIEATGIDLVAARRHDARWFHTGNGTTLDTDVLWRMLTGDFLAHTLEAMSSGQMDWESPVGGARMATAGGIWLTDFLFAYRIVLAPCDLTCYVLVSGHPCQVIGILLPADRIVFTNGPGCRDYIDDFHHVSIATLLIRHLCQYGDLMIGAWRAGTAGFAALFRERLISGQLWHDLTGLDRLVRRLPGDRLPDIIGMWGNRPEIYGDTETIFPATRGRITRSLKDDDAMIRHAYDRRLLLTRPTSSYVTRTLYTKLIEVSTRDAGIASRRTAAAIRSRGGPLVLLGLRVENRTVEDLPEFCAQIIDYLTLRCGPVTIVIDGHNTARGETTNVSFASEFQQHAKEAPIDVERRVVKALRDRYKNSSVTLIDNIGGSMARSIFWCRSAHFFVTMYGTGLAKYRWACNQTGLIVTSRWTLRHQDHLHIYEQDFLEDPSPLMFLPERHVEDLPDSPCLISEPGNPPARWNFKVRPEGLHAALDELLRRTWHAAASPVSTIDPARPGRAKRARRVGT